MNQNNRMKYIMKAVVTMLLLVSVGSVSASTLKLDATGVDVKNSSGVSVSTNLGAKFGYFASGFTATTANLAQWDENFISMNGQWSLQATLTENGSSGFGIALSFSSTSSQLLVGSHTNGK